MVSKAKQSADEVAAIGTRKAPDSVGDSAIGLEKFVENLPGNLVQRTLHPDGRFTYSFISQGLKDTFGIEPADIVSQREADFGWIVEQDREPFRAALYESAKTLNTLDIENRVIGADGRIKWVRSIGKPRRLPDGAVVWDGIALDVTDKKQAESEMRAALHLAEQADAAKTKFLAAASHDLRQPLQAMRFHLAAMRESGAASEPIDNLDRCVDSMESLLSSLLDISKLDAGVVHPQIEPVALHALIERVAAEAQPMAEDAGSAIRVEGPEVTVGTDAALLGTVIRNLVQNAVKYGGGGAIQVRLRPVTAGAVLLVADRGIGMSPDDQSRVFEPFVQLGNVARDRSLGLGLGLAIVERITRLLGARLALKSRPGQGTVFRLAIPHSAIASGAAATPEPAPGPTAPGSLEGRRIWVLEDDREVSTALGELIDQWGGTVETTTTTEELEALAEAAEPPDAIIADFRLASPRTGGQALSGLRTRFGREIPGIILTGDTDPARLRDAEASGFQVLHKPVKPARLKALLRYLIETDDPGTEPA
ncbi:MAG: ATP-binding protein [Alphaproteobacteria bacterium]|nr:ATP-binding protein [Alphaproteobacteria bacterium]